MSLIALEMPVLWRTFYNWVCLLFVGGITCIFLLTGCNPRNSVNTSDDAVSMVWIFCEDQGLFFPQYGDSTVAMPALTALASEGTVFDNMYSVSPVCAPSRSSIMTGILPTALGTQHMRAYGKGKRRNPHTGLPFYSAPAPAGVRAFTEYMRAQGVYCTNRFKEDYNFEAPPLAWDASSPTAHWRNRPDGAPFFSIINLFASHESQVWAKADHPCGVSNHEIEVPPILPDDPAVRKDLATNYCNLMKVDSALSEIVAQLKEDGLYAQTTIVFTSDHGGPFPGFKRSVSEAGLHVPFVVKWGQGVKAPARHAGLFSFLDLAPMALAHFGIPIPPALSGMPVGIQSHGHGAVFGAGDRFDSELHRKRSVRAGRWRLTRHDLGKPELSFGITYRNQMGTMNAIWNQPATQNTRTESSRLSTPTWELYDVLADPWCQRSLAGDDAMQSCMDSLRALLNEAFPKDEDWGQWDESEMVNHFSVLTGVPLAAASLQHTSSGWSLAHEDPNVSLGWRCADAKSGWFLSPIPHGLDCDTLESLSHRIGWPSKTSSHALR